MTDLLLNEDSPKRINRTVVRLSTSMWFDDNGLYFRQTLRFLKRKSAGQNNLFEDCFATGAEEVLPRITNLHNCPDGVYEVIACNFGRDWESGYIEEWDYELVPYSEKDEKA